MSLGKNKSASNMKQSVLMLYIWYVVWSHPNKNVLSARRKHWTQQLRNGD